MKLSTIVLLFILFEEILCCGQLQTTLIPLLANTITTHHWPWHVAVYHQVNESIKTYKCGGTLISRKAILTAAHCVLKNAEEVTVSLGRLLLNSSESSAPYHKVAEIIHHPDYSYEHQENDIAIIILATSAVFDNYVQPVCLWMADKTDLSEVHGKYGTVVGWGLTGTGEAPNALREAALPVVNLTTCLRSHRDLFGRYLSETNFCAGNRNGTSVCAGDSGGSLSFKVNGKFYIRGIVSVGANKEMPETHEIVCDPMQYALFTDVAQYLPWIQSSVISDECDIIVQCGWSDDSRQCTVIFHSDTTTAECSIIFNDIPNAEINELRINGESDVIPKLSDAVTKFENLDGVTLASISLKVVERHRLTPFINIKKLDLSSNSISQFNADDGDTFDDLANLKELNISNSKLIELHPDLFKELKNLEILILSVNDLRNLPANTFHSNRKMREIDLSNNQLKELHIDLFAQLVHLEFLFIHRNRLAALPAKIFRSNGKLRSLALSFNQLTTVHADQFKELHSLERIDLDHNKLENLPSGLFRNNINSKKIYLNDNQLKELHVDQFKDLYSLEILWLFNNKLEALPDGLFHSNRNIERLSLTGNQLKELHVDLFAQLSNLEDLRVHINKLVALPADIFRNNGKLRNLVLSFNQLTAVHADQFKELHSLASIYLNNNQLETIPPGLFRNNRKMTYINLEFNKIRKIELELSQATHPAITTFYLSGNVCIDEECGFIDSCDALTLSKIFDKIQKNC